MYSLIPDRLIELVPEFKQEVAKQIFIAYITEYDDINQYALISELLRFLIDLVRSSAEHPENLNAISRILYFVEELAASKDELIRTLIATGFMENIHAAESWSVYQFIKQRMGLHSLELLQSAEQFWLSEWLASIDKQS